MVKNWTCSACSVFCPNQTTLAGEINPVGDGLRRAVAVVQMRSEHILNKITAYWRNSAATKGIITRRT
jgi:hypothetical protein